MLSVSDWRIKRFLEAPRASRTDVCARRAVPRAISRLAIFAHAISNTRQHDEQDAQAVFVVLFHRPHAGASRDDLDILLGRHGLDLG